MGGWDSLKQQNRAVLCSSGSQRWIWSRNSKVYISVLLGSEGLQRQAGKESSWELLDLGARAERDSSLDICNLQFCTNA